MARIGRGMKTYRVCPPEVSVATESRRYCGTL